MTLMDFERWGRIDHFPVDDIDGFSVIDANPSFSINVWSIVIDWSNHIASGMMYLNLALENMTS